MAVKRVIVGMSGGVDSSVAALLLKRAGYEVFGVTMKITPEPLQKNTAAERKEAATGPKNADQPAENEPGRTGKEGREPWGGGAPAPRSTDDDRAASCSRGSLSKVSRDGRRLACFGDDEEEEIREAEAVAGHIGIPFYVVDLSREYEERILVYFRNEYARGRTPNPCVRCNAEIKFGLLLEGCRKLGVDYDYFATGHYARVRYDGKAGRWCLLRAKDRSKDQSYFLSLLKQEQLARSLFPLGELSKAEVRQIAREAGLPVSEKEESQDFYAGDYRQLLGPGRRGYIKDLSGRVLGEHDGIENFTIGQRRGLGISSTGRLYVVRIEAETATVYVGEEKDLLKQTFQVEGLNWISRIPQPGEEVEATVRVRYRSPELNCRFIPGFSGEMGRPECEDGKAGLKEVEKGGRTGTGENDFTGFEAGKEISGTGKKASADVKELAAVVNQNQMQVRKDGALVPDSATVILYSPFKAITPGQVAVFYDGEVVLGGGFIS